MASPAHRKLAASLVTQPVNIPTVHLNSVARCVTDFDNCNQRLLQAVTLVMNATLALADISLAKMEPGTTYFDLYDEKRNGSIAVQDAWNALELSFGDLTLKYRNLKAACESVVNSLEGDAERLQALTGASASCSGESGATQWTVRCHARVHELLNELLAGYAAHLPVVLSIVTRLKPWATDENAGSWVDPMPFLPSFPSEPGLPPSSRSDREHLTALASIVALPPYVDAVRIKSIIEALGVVLKTVAVPTPA